jgi:glycosidase
MNFLEVSIPHLSKEGTFRSALLTLTTDHLMEGIDALYLLPIFQPSLATSRSPYCITDFKALNPQLGNWRDFSFFIESIHALGKKVVLDLVLNHTSPLHPWTHRPDFYVLDLGGKPTAPPHTNWDDVIQLNHENPEVQNELLNVIDFWLALGVDGFRFDAARFIPNAFWEKALARMENKLAWADSDLPLPFTHFTCKESIHERSVVFTTNHDELLSKGSIKNQFGEHALDVIKKRRASAKHYMSIPYEDANLDYYYDFRLSPETISHGDL